MDDTNPDDHNTPPKQDLPAQARSERVFVRLSTAEKSSWKAAAAASRMTLSNFVRHLINTNLRIDK